MKKGQRPPIKETAHDAGFAGAFDVPTETPPPAASSAPELALIAAEAPKDPEPARRGRKPGRNRRTHSVSLDDGAYERIMRAVADEGLEFSAFMEKAGLRLLEAMEERRGSPYPPIQKAKSVLDDF